MARISEWDIQRALCIWLDGSRTAPPALKSDAIYFHVPNGGSRNAAEGARFKQIGVKPGIFDLCFFHAGKFYALELKDEKGKLSDAQLAMWERYKAAGAGGIAWANNLTAAKATCRAWGLIVDNM